MPSEARNRLAIALGDVDALLAHAKSFSNGRRGAPAAVGGISRPGRPFTRAATVLLAGAVEGYVEAVVAETGGHLGLSAQQQRDLQAQIKRSHGANVYHVHQLTAQIGLPFVADQIGWQGLPAGGVRTLLSEIANRRNRIAHGNAPNTANVAEVERWRGLVATFADKLDKQCASAVKRKTGSQPW